MKKYLVAFLIMAFIGQLYGQTIAEVRAMAEKKASAGDYKGALVLYDKAVADGIANDYMYIESGHARKMLGDLDGAIRDFDKGLETIIYGRNDILFGRGKLKFAAERYEEALADFTENIEKGRDYCDYYYYRALTKIKLEDKAGACEDFKAAVSPERYGWWEKNFAKETEIEIFRHCG